MKTLSALVFGLILALFAVPAATAFAADSTTAASQDGDGKKKHKKGKKQGKKKGGKKGKKSAEKSKKKDRKKNKK